MKPEIYRRQEGYGELRRRHESLAGWPTSPGVKRQLPLNADRGRLGVPQVSRFSRPGLPRRVNLRVWLDRVLSLRDFPSSNGDRNPLT